MPSSPIDLDQYDHTTPFFHASFDGKLIEAKVVHVYDGDTVQCVFPLGSSVYQWNVRLAQIDTPEIKAKMKGLSHEQQRLSQLEKRAGLVAKQYVAAMLLNKRVVLECKAFEKFGRLLATIRVDGVDVCQHLIERGFAHAYAGATKSHWTETELDGILSKGGAAVAA
jgi:endonuclease YncB( thermonuclease family)